MFLSMSSSSLSGSCLSGVVIVDGAVSWKSFSSCVFALSALFLGSPRRSEFCSLCVSSLMYDAWLVCLFSNVLSSHV